MFARLLIVGGATNTMTLNSTTADDGGVVVDAQLNLTSSESFSVGGTSADIVGATSSTKTRWTLLNRPLLGSYSFF